MILGATGLVLGFLNSPSTVSEAQQMVANSHHNESHDSSLDLHENFNDENKNLHNELSGDHYEKENPKVHKDDHHQDHGEHLLHQLQNRPWAALYVAALFFFMIPLGVLAFYAINRAAQAGWSIVLYRVMEGITGYLLPGSIIVFLILVLSVMHLNHLFIWMDPEVVAHDELIQGKSGYLNTKWFLVRALFYMEAGIFIDTFQEKFLLLKIMVIIFQIIRKILD